MSKGKVWNRGKHNGGGLPPRKLNKDLIPAANISESMQPELQVGKSDSIPTRINTVQRMNRDNWVQRATPIKRENKGKTE